MNLNSSSKYLCRKWIGVIWLTLEVGLISGNIFGFTSIFQVLPKYGIYSSYCSTVAVGNDCEAQTKKYQDALTLGLIFFNLPSVFLGALIDLFGARFMKLIAVILHIIGWLALGLAKPGEDHLIFIHTVFTSCSGFIVLLTAFASSAYFSKSRALISTIFAGATITAAIWYSIFQIAVDANLVTLPQLCYIWSSFGFLLLISSFLFLDWKFSILNLPYSFDVQLESANTIPTKTKWYLQMYQRDGIWKYLTSPLYIMIVLFASVLLIPVDLLSITWYPRVFYLTNENVSLANKYTNAFNFSILLGIILCPINGFLLGYRSYQNEKQKLLNTSIMQTITWLLSVISCIVCLFVTTSVIIPSLVLNSITRSMIVSGPQAVIATFFPSKHIGTLSGTMWTLVGAMTFVQYGLVQLTYDVPKSWRAWLIVLCLVIIMFSHVIQLWFIYFQEQRNEMQIDIKPSKLEVKENKSSDIGGMITKF